MGFESVSNLEVSVPDFKSSIPSNRCKIGFEGRFGRSLQLGRISDLGDPVLMVGIV